MWSRTYRVTDTWGIKAYLWREACPYELRADAAVGSKFSLSPFALALEVKVSGCWSLKVFLSSIWGSNYPFSRRCLTIQLWIILQFCVVSLWTKNRMVQSSALVEASSSDHFHYCHQGTQEHFDSFFDPLINPQYKLLYLGEYSASLVVIFSDFGSSGVFRLSYSPVKDLAMPAMEASLFLNTMPALFQLLSIMILGILASALHRKLMVPMLLSVGIVHKKSHVYALNADYSAASRNSNNGLTTLFVCFVLLISFHLIETMFWSQFWVHKKYTTLKCVWWLLHVYVWVCVHVHMYACSWRPQVDVKSHLLRVLFKDLLLNLGWSRMATLADPWAPRVYLSLIALCWCCRHKVSCLTFPCMLAIQT